jgi:hypothetical protein
VGQSGAGVHEDDLEAPGELPDNRPEVPRLGGLVALDARIVGEDTESVDGRERLVDPRFAGQDVVQRRFVFDPEDGSQVRHRQVRVDDDHVAAPFLQCRRDVDRRRRLSDAALSARERVAVTPHNGSVDEDWPQKPSVGV